MKSISSRRSVAGLLVAVVLGSLAGGAAQAATRRALLIGIDRYEPPRVSNRPSRWRDLNGAANDARAMRSLLVSRYGVNPQDARLLVDDEASRERILASVSELARESGPGDRILFYFAGHGSQQRNASSRESDRLDETIVPADSYAGARDIRDKELRARFGDLLDTGASLVAIFDSCSSGSIVRSLKPAGEVRYLPPSSEAPSPPGVDDERPAPETRGALIFSAAQDGQAAHETIDSAGRPRGAFSLALLRAMRESSPDEPAEHVFLRARAALMVSPAEQHPVLAGRERERRAPLFSSHGVAAEGVVTAAVREVRGEEVVLDAGIAAGLNPGAELGRSDPRAAVPFRLRVTEAKGMTQSTARVLTGDPSAIRPGHLFQLQRWVPARRAQLRLALPPSASEQTRSQVLNVAAALTGDSSVTWIDDPSERLSHRAAWNGAGWRLEAADGGSVDLGEELTAAGLRARLGATRDAPARLFVAVPPSQALRDVLQAHVDASAGTLSIVEAAHADYWLEGAVARLEGAAARPGGARAAPAQQHEGVPAGAREAAAPGDAAAADRVRYAWVRGSSDTPGLPPRSDWFGGALAASALEQALGRLAQVAGWLKLESPPQDGSFPYQLALADVSTRRRIPGGVVFEGDEYRLLLHRAETADTMRITPRYVYIFAIDSYGERALLFPASTAGGVENRLPRPGGSPRSIPLGEPIRIGPPFGHDTLVMVASEQPLADPRVLEGKGIRTRRGGLDGLLGEVGRYDRERPKPTSLGWSVRRVSIRSLPR